MVMTLISGVAVSERSVEVINESLKQLMCSQLQKQYGVSIPNLMKHDIEVPFVQEIIDDACKWVDCQEWSLYKRCMDLMKDYRNIDLDKAVRGALFVELSNSTSSRISNHSEVAHRIVRAVRSSGFGNVDTSVILARLIQIPNLHMSSLFFSALDAELLDKSLEANGIGTSFIEILETNSSLFKEWSFSRSEMFYIACRSADNHLHEIDQLFIKLGL